MFSSNRIFLGKKWLWPFSLGFLTNQLTSCSIPGTQLTSCLQICGTQFLLFFHIKLIDVKEYICQVRYFENLIHLIMQVIWSSFASNVQVICKSFETHMQVMCRLFVSYVQVVYKSFETHLQDICKLYASHVQAMCKPHASHVQATCKRYAIHVQIMCKSCTSHSKIICNSFGSHSNQGEIYLQSCVNHMQIRGGE